MTSFERTAEQRSHEDALRALTAARIALGAALAANHNARVSGRVEPCDEPAIAELVANVLTALTAAQDRGVRTDVRSVLTFYANDGTRLPLPTAELAQPA